MLEWHDLNARHEATLLWLAAMLIIGIAGSAEDRRSVCDLLKMLLEPTISLLIVGLLVLQRRISKCDVWPFVFGHERAIAVGSWQYVVRFKLVTKTTLPDKLSL